MKRLFHIAFLLLLTAGTAAAQCSGNKIGSSSFYCIKSGNDTASSGPISVSFPLGYPAGSTVIVEAGNSFGSVTSGMISDTSGLSWTFWGGATVSGQGIGLWYVSLPGGSAPTDTITITTSANFPYMMATVYGNLGAIDGAGASNTGNSTVLSSGNYPVTIGDLNIGFLFGQGSTAVGSGWTERNSSGVYFVSEDQVAASTTANATGTSNSGGWAVIGVAFKAGSGYSPPRIDAYGGDTSNACVGVLKNNSAIPGTTGYFYLYKDTNVKHWMFCDPLGYRKFHLAVQVIDASYYANESAVNSKYGSLGYYPTQTIRLQQLGFNAIGEYANLNMYPSVVTGGSNTNPMPFEAGYINPSHYALGAANGVKSMTPLLPPAYNNFNGYRANDWPDYFAAGWQTHLNAMFSSGELAGVNPSWNNSPWLIGVTLDDGDYLWGLRVHGGWMTAVDAPYAYYMNIQGAGGDNLFSDPVVYSKAQLPTNLTAKYGTIAALNAAWGSTYTTFGSSATTVASETFGTGNGSTTTFNHTLAHTVVDPASILITVGSTPAGGDCPWFEYYCANLSDGTPGTGDLIGVAANMSHDATTINYSTGVASITFSSAPGNGVVIHISYQYGGWPKATAGGTGLLDEDGSSPWWPATMPNNFSGTTLQNDLETFWIAIATQYYSPFTGVLRSNLPNHLVGGSVGTITDDINILNTEATYVDFLAAAGGYPTEDANTGQTEATTVYNVIGIPSVMYNLLTTSSDSQYVWSNCAASGYPDRCAPTQPLRGQMYLSFLSAFWNAYKGADGYGFVVGSNWWQMTDNSGETSNYGLVSSATDNLYGYLPGYPSLTEDITASITDPFGLTTIGEAATHGNFIESGLFCANQIWLGMQCLGTAPRIGHLP